MVFEIWANLGGRINKLTMQVWFAHSCVFRFHKWRLPLNRKLISPNHRQKKSIVWSCGLMFSETYWETHPMYHMYNCLVTKWLFLCRQKQLLNFNYRKRCCFLLWCFNNIHDIWGWKEVEDDGVFCPGVKLHAIKSLGDWHVSVLEKGGDSKARFHVGWFWT